MPADLPPIDKAKFVAAKRAVGSNYTTVEAK